MFAGSSLPAGLEREDMDKKEIHVDPAIQSLRKRIDAIDQEIAGCLNRRAGCVLEVGEIKERTGMPIYDPGRERQIVERLARKNTGPLPDAAIRRLFERIIDESRSLERFTRETASADRKEKSGG